MDFKALGIPDYILQSIRDAGGWAEGDTWILGKGRFLEYHFKTNSFQIKENGQIVHTIPFRKMMRDG